MALLLSSRGPAAVALALLALVAAPTAAIADDDTTASYTCVPAPLASQLTVSFGPEVSLAELATWVAGFTCESVVIAPGIARRATRLQVIVPAPLTVRQALKLFNQTLEAAGLRVKRRDRTFTITTGPGTPRTCPELVAGDGSDEPVAGALPIDTDALADKVAAGVRRIDATHATVPRALIDALLASPVAFGRAARAIPALKAGAVIGFKLYAVRPGGLCARLGLANGDTVTAIDGVALDTMDRALDAFSTLRTATTVELAVTRHGKPLTLTVAIVP